MHTRLLSLGLAQRAHLFIAPRILGGRNGPRLVGDLGIRSVAESIRLEEIKMERLGEDLLLTGRIRSTADPLPRES